jgi:hypothetical protein
MAMGYLGGSDSRGRAGVLALAVGLAFGVFALARDACAYTAAGDRLFPATGILPQIAPADAFYVWGWTLPLDGGPTGATARAIDLGAVFEKTITERFSIHFEQGWTRLDRVDAGAWQGWENFETELKFRAFESQPHEFLLTLGLNREWGSTGAARTGSPAQGATTPRVYFGKGLGDHDIGYLRPLAVIGVFGYQVADSRPRPDLVTTGFAIEYSIPYLQSKVHSFNLPGWLRGMTPLTEVSFAIPAGRSFGARTTALVATGFSYAGEGWEFLAEAMVPATRATAAGAGVRLQLNLSLDYLFPDTIGRPLLSSR